MKVSPLVLQTFGRLAGLGAFVDALDRALPESEWAENAELKRKAEDEEWEWSDFDVGRQALDERFQFWLPRFTTYSALTLLHTIVEVQLATCAKLAASQKQSLFKPSELRGKGVAVAVLFLKRCGIFDASQDQAWQTICDLRDLRHLIVHRVGTKGETEQHRKTARRLTQAYPGRIVFREDDWSWYGEVWIAIPLCRDFITQIEHFFDRLFDAMQLPPRFEARSR